MKFETEKLAVEKLRDAMFAENASAIEAFWCLSLTDQVYFKAEAFKLLGGDSKSETEKTAKFLAWDTMLEVMLKKMGARAYVAAGGYKYHDGFSKSPLMFANRSEK